MAARVLVFTALIPALLLLGCAPGTGGHKTVATSDDSGDPTANGGSGTDKTASEPAPLSGVNLVFSVDQKKIDPTTVSGYIVGAVGSLVIEPYAAATSDSNPTYVIKNVPAGNHDVIVTAGALAISSGGSSTLRLASAAKDSGRRLKGIVFSADKTTEAGLLDLPKFGSISGVATLAGQSKYAGIDVYVPGTDMVAKTDDKGNFAISAVPVGVHDLYYDMSGYYRGQVENISVTSQQNTTVAAIQLMLSTGAKGILVLSGGAAISSSRTVSLNIGATPDAVLMMISENSSFVGAKWVPIVTSTQYTFVSPGSKVLYTKFADSNGLESGVYSASIDIQIFGQTEGTFAIDSGANRSYNRTTDIAISLPNNAANMVFCEVSSFSGCSWEAKSSTKSYVFSSDGNKTLYAKYKDVDGFESPVQSSSIAIDNNTSMSIVVNGGAAYVTTTTVALTLAATGASQMYVTNTAGCGSGGSWENFATTKSWTLGQTNATATVYAKFKDASGNESACVSGSIIHDNIPPSGASISVSNGTGLSPVTLILAAVGASQMYISNTSNCSSGGSWESYATSKIWTLPQPITTVSVKFRDAASNESSCVNTTITLPWFATTLSQARTYIGVTTIGTKAIFAGGYDSSPAHNSNVVDIYDSSANGGGGGWSAATLSQARNGIVAASVGTKAIFAGGSSLNIVDIYDSSANGGAGGWSIANLSQARSGMVASSVGTKVLFAGGTNGGSASNVVDIYDISANGGAGGWSTAALSQARYVLVAITLGTKAIFAGGYSSSANSNVVDIYDSSANGGSGGWSTAALSQSRCDIGAAIVGTRAIFAGGQSASGISNVVDIYDSSANGGAGGWSTATLSQARMQIVATTVGNKAIFAGGSLGGFSKSNVVDIYDASANGGAGGWSTATLSKARYSMVAATVGTKAIFAGGAAETGYDGYTNVVDIYDASAGTWTTSTLSQARTNIAMTILGTKVIYAGGTTGANSNQGISNVVDILIP